MLRLAEVLGTCSINQALPTVENIFELTYRGEGEVRKVQFGFEIALSAEHCLVLLQEKQMLSSLSYE